MSSLLFGNGTDMVHWKPSNQTRGTFDILSTCVITMLLCVWTAIHLNVPSPGSVWGQQLRKVGWLILALLAPEMVAYTAWYQRMKALSVMRNYNKAYKLPNPPTRYEIVAKSIGKAVVSFKKVLIPRKWELSRQPTLEAQTPNDREPWTVVHGFFVGMGGLAIHISKNLPEYKKFLAVDINETWFITGGGISSLINQEPNNNGLKRLSEDEIKSKSKASGLAKTLVCIQASWFISQCLTRLIKRVPVSLLELNTFGHAVCALLIYILWWEKPLDVGYPTIIESATLLNFRALYVTSAMSSRFRHRYKSFRTSVVHSANNWINAYLEGDQRFKQFDTVTQQLLLEKLEFNDEFQLLAACYNEVTASNSNVLMDFDGKFETDLDQRPEDKSKETGLTVLISGHNLIGALWKLEGSSAFDNYLRDKIKPWLLMDLDAHKKSSEISSISHECDATLSDDLSRFKLILTARDVIRWKMAWRALCALREHEEKDSKKIAEKKDSEENSENKSDEEIFDEAISKKKSDRGGFLGDYNRVGRYDRFLLRRCNDWPETYELFEPQIAFGFGMGTLIYGGLHALAWSANFHSPVERILWRVSTCVVMGGVPVLFVLSLVMRRLIPVYAVSSIHWRYSFFKTMLDTIFPHIPELVALLIFAAYVLARAYLVVECFINLFHLPAAVYDVPTWSVYFPHIS